MYSRERGTRAPLEPRTRLRARCGQLDVALALRDQRALDRARACPRRRLVRALRGSRHHTKRFPAVPLVVGGNPRFGNYPAPDAGEFSQSSGSEEDDDELETGSRVPWLAAKEPPGLARSVLSSIFCSTSAKPVGGVGVGGVSVPAAEDVSCALCSKSVPGRQRRDPGAPPPFEVMAAEKGCEFCSAPCPDADNGSRFDGETPSEVTRRQTDPDDFRASSPGGMDGDEVGSERAIGCGGPAAFGTHAVVTSSSDVGVDTVDFGGQSSAGLSGVGGDGVLQTNYGSTASGEIEPKAPSSAESGKVDVDGGRCMETDGGEGAERFLESLGRGWHEFAADGRSGGAADVRSSKDGGLDASQSLLPKLHEVLAVDLNIEVCSCYHVHSPSLYSFVCAQLFRRAEYAGHVRDVHSTLADAFGHWLEVRCPLAHLGCTFSAHRRMPRAARVVFSPLTESLGLRRTDAAGAAEERAVSSDRSRPELVEGSSVLSADVRGTSGVVGENVTAPSEPVFSVESCAPEVPALAELAPVATTSLRGNFDAAVSATVPFGLTAAAETDDDPAAFGQSRPQSATHRWKERTPELLTASEFDSAVTLVQRHSKERSPTTVDDDDVLRLTNLPFELLTRVAAFLDAFSLRNLSLTCWLMRDVCRALLRRRGLVVQEWERRWSGDRPRWRVSHQVFAFPEFFERKKHFAEM